MKNRIIAIDGFSSCGKSSFAKSIAKKYGYIFIDTGAMYRAVTLFALRNGMICDGVVNVEKVLRSLPQLMIYFRSDGSNDRIMLGEEDVSDAIRSAEVNQYVSQISQIAEVRRKMVLLQQAMGKQGGIVMDGRDIGTVVFPDADLKIFMTASVDVRADRRYKELLASGEDVKLEDIKANLAYRDHLDQTRSESPLKRAGDALLLDNSTMTIPQQMEWVDGLLRNLGFIS